HAGSLSRLLDVRPLSRLPARSLSPSKGLTLLGTGSLSPSKGPTLGIRDPLIRPRGLRFRPRAPGRLVAAEEVEVVVGDLTLRGVGLEGYPPLGIHPSRAMRGIGHPSRLGKAA